MNSAAPITAVERAFIDAAKARLRARENADAAADKLITSFGDDDAGMSRSYVRCLQIARAEHDEERRS